MFDIHKVKPVHGWRDFIGEVGIIVLGVLIALSAEQVVEIFHNREQLAETRSFLNDSLADAKIQAWARVVLNQCINERLRTLRADIESGRAADGEFIPPTPITIWQVGPWNTAVASGSLLHMNLAIKSQYDIAFEQMASIQDLNNKEFAEWSELHVLDQPTHLTEATKTRLIADAAKAKALNGLISLASRELYDDIKDLGVSLTAAQMGQFSEGVAYVRKHHCTLPAPQGKSAMG